MSEGPNLAWAGVCALAMHDGITNITAQPDPIYHRQIDERWKVTLNGSKKTHKIDGAELPPFGVYVEYNGWPAGMIDPAGGIIAAGDAANEDAFVAAIESVLGSDIETYLASKGE